MLAHVEGDRLVRVEGNPAHPFTRGHLCRKVAHYEERVYSPDRLLYPMRRVGPKGAGRFERISWEEALDEIVARWQAIIAEYGPEAILPYSYAGTMGVVNMAACEGRLWNRLGATRLARTICSTAGEAGHTYTLGWSGGIDPEAFALSKFIIAWGTNLCSTNVHQMVFIREAQKRGATFVVIDPYHTRTAQSADWFVQVKPGTDTALALAMMHVIFAENLHDEEYLEQHTIGWRALRERAAEYPPERASAITGIPAEEIASLGRRYATEQPSAIRMGYGLTRNSNGGMIARTITCLPALIGAWRKPGGGLLLSTSSHFPWNRAAVKRPDLTPLSQGSPARGLPTGDWHRFQGLGEGRKAGGEGGSEIHTLPGLPPSPQPSPRWGEGPFPLSLSGRGDGGEGKRPPIRTVNMNELGKALTELTNPPIMSLMVWNCNPAAVTPNSNLVRRGLEREDLFTIVHEQMMTDTARYADILLPATTQMEHLDLHFAYGHLYVQLNQPAIPPLGEARPNIEVQHALAKRLGFTDPCFEETAEDIIRKALDTEELRAMGITYEYLCEHGFAKISSPLSLSGRGDGGEGRTPPLFLPFMDGRGFRTPSGKIELYSEQAARDGFDPLPRYEPLAESPEGNPELACRYPINLLTPAAHHFLNSSFANIPSLQKAEKEPRIWVNPKDAAARGIQNGDWLRVWNDRGEVRLKAVVSQNVKPGVAWSPSLWWHRDSPLGGNVNALTSDRLTDMGGGPTFHTNLVEFEKEASGQVDSSIARK